MSNAAVETEKPASSIMLTTLFHSAEKPSAASTSRGISKLSRRSKTAESKPPLRKPDSFKRSRALKRGGSWVPLHDDHLKYLWAAYRRGSFDKVDFLPKDLKQEPFRDAVFEFVGRLLKAGGEAYSFLGHTPFGEIPVGLVLLVVNGPYAEPHVVWFPEASPRNRLELALAFLVAIKRHFKFHLWVRQSDWKLYDHLCKYGVIRTVGKRRKFYPDGEDAFLFQEVA